MTGEPFVVCNPTSGRGRGGRLLEPLLAALGAGGPVGHAVTRQPGEEARLTREAIGRGHEVIVALGGDGTWSNVANAMLDSGKSGVLGLVPGGTGSDLARSLGIPARDVAACAQIIRAGRVRAIDVGRIEQRYFINIAGFGYDVAVLEDSWNVRWLKGNLVYLYCALKQIFSFSGFRVGLAADAAPERSLELLMLIVANARVFGGGFRIAPAADLADGRLDLMAFGNASPRRRLGLMGQLLKGTHEQAPEVEALRAERVRLRFPAPPSYETDGEWHRAASAELEISALPGALRVLAPEP